MLDVFTVAFFGHRYITDVCRIEEMLEDQVRELISSHAYVEFLVGNNGTFDQCVASAVRRVKKRYRADNSSLVLVLPYHSALYQKNEKAFREFYDDIVLSAAAETAHPKAAIQVRNREMVDRADRIIAYVHRKGGAWSAVQYALRSGKPVVNLSAEEPQGHA